MTLVFTDEVRGDIMDDTLYCEKLITLDTLCGLEANGEVLDRQVDIKLAGVLKYPFVGKEFDFACINEKIDNVLVCSGNLLVVRL